MSRGGCRSKSSSSTIDLNWPRLENRTFCATADCWKAHLARPRNFFSFGEDDVVVLAVALMAGIARAHAFAQGNKRTAFAAMRLFLRVNGYDTAFDDSVPWANRMIEFAEHRGTEEDFVRAVRPFVGER
jgi:death-on-curing family protein